jgi:hypothetical protein
VGLKNGRLRFLKMKNRRTEKWKLVKKIERFMSIESRHKLLSSKKRVYLLPISGQAPTVRAVKPLFAPHRMG